MSRRVPDFHVDLLLQVERGVVMVDLGYFRRVVVDEDPGGVSDDEGRFAGAGLTEHGDANRRFGTPSQVRAAKQLEGAPEARIGATRRRWHAFELVASSSTSERD